MREDATAVLQALMNPAAIQGGIIGIKGVQKAYADFLRAFGRDPDGYLEIRATPMSPEHELATIVSGGQVRAVPGIDIQSHLLAHQQQLMDPVVRSVLTDDQLKAIQRLMAEEIQLAQSLMMAQALGQGGGTGQQRPRGPEEGEARAGQQAPQPNAQPGARTNLGPQGGGQNAGPQ